MKRRRVKRQPPGTLTGFIRAVGLSAFLLASIPASLQATDVSGTISANTTWGLAGSPYNLVGYTRVNYGATLTIDPGVLVIGNGKRLQIFGILSANGSNSSMVVFSV